MIYIYKGGYQTSLEQAMQTLGGDSSVLIPLMSAVTEHLGFVFTQSILQKPPFNFARRVSTLDHMTKGRVGRNPEDILFFQGLTFVVGGTDEEAKRKDASYREYLYEEAFAAQLSSAAGQDISAVDLNTPLEKIKTNTQQGWLNSLRQSAPDQSWTLGEVLLWHRNRQLVGCPERLADVLQTWKDSGVDGINVTHVISPGSYEDFADGLAPELRKHGLLKTEYLPGTLREKLYGQGDRLKTNHPISKRELSY
ncbi:hypothetical protein [Acinetobacter sp. NS-4]|uniref:hypothetical protein n=1 Tax=Acinetobacter sp. NS-4 TaxID=3127956 RepID=UPI00307F50E5